MRVLLLLWLLVLTTLCKAQKSYQQYRVGNVPGIERFNTLTAREVRLDSLKKIHSEEKLQRIQDGSAFVSGVSEKDKQEAIQYEKIMAIPYRNNRSRYFMEQYVNHEPEKDLSEKSDMLTTECNCYLSDDTIKINMGIWVFGGFGFNLAINKKNFYSEFWYDLHENPAFKTVLTQKEMSDNILVGNNLQELILEKAPAFLLGEEVTGYMKFKTDNYFRSSEYKSYMASDMYSDARMDTLYMKGELYFKCQLRQKTIFDE